MRVTLIGPGTGLFGDTQITSVTDSGLGLQRLVIFFVTVTFLGIRGPVVSF